MTERAVHGTQSQTKSPIEEQPADRYSDSVVTVKSIILFVVLTILNISVFVFMVFENQMELIAKNAELESKDKGISIKVQIERIVTGYEMGSAHRRYEVVAPMAPVYSNQGADSVALDTLVLGETVFSDFEIDSWHRIVYRDNETGWVPADRLIKHVPAWKTGKLSAEDVRLILDVLERKGVDRYTVFMESGYVLADSHGREGEQATDAEAEAIKKAVFNNSFEDLAFYQHVDRGAKSIDLYIPVYYSLNRLFVIRPTIPMRYVDIQKRFLYRQCTIIGFLVLLVHVAFVLVNYRYIIHPMVDRRTSLLEAKNTQIEDARERLQKTYNELNEAHSIITDELETARELQLALIPQDLPHLPGYRFATRYLPAERVSGDYYDVFPVDDEHVGILLADASGHGIPAAFVVSMAKMWFASHATKGELSTAAIMRLANADLEKSIRTFHYLTAVYIILHVPSGRITYTRASHPPPIVARRSSRELEHLDTEGLFLAMMEEGEYGEKQSALKSGDRVVLYTDGIIEALDVRGQQYGRKAFDRCVRRHADEDIEQMADSLLADTRQFAAGRAFIDDVTLLILEKE